MKILENHTTHAELKQLAANIFGHMIKAVIDIRTEAIAVDAELHSDLEALLLQKGSKQRDLWGINFYPDMEGDDFIEFDSMINVRPSQNNRTRGVESVEIRNKIIRIVSQRIAS